MRLGRVEPPIKKHPMWYVYILKCADNTLYTGATTDVIRRVKEHNRKKGGACTSARLPVKIVYKESYEMQSQALKREAQIKRWSRKKKLALVAGNLRELKSLYWYHKIDVNVTQIGVSPVLGKTGQNQRLSPENQPFLAQKPAP